MLVDLARGVANTKRDQIDQSVTQDDGSDMVALGDRGGPRTGERFIEGDVHEVSAIGFELDRVLWHAFQAFHRASEAGPVATLAALL